MTEVARLFDLNVQAWLQGPALLAALGGFGLLVGVLTGLFGVGGGFMVVPLLHVAFGIPYPWAVGSSLAFTIGTGASGASRHWRLRNVEVRAAAVMGAAAFVGAMGGAAILGRLHRAIGRGGAERFNLLMDGLFIVLLCVTACLVWRGSDRPRTGASPLQRLALPPYVALPAANLARVSAPGLLLVGLGVGVLTGLLGIGGGVLFVPLLILVVGLGPHQAVGTSLGVVLLGSIAGTIKHGAMGHVSLPVAMALLAGSVFGVQIGAWVCQKLHAGRLRRWFALLVIAVAAVLVVSFVRKLL